jgi:hypothetical protein
MITFKANFASLQETTVLHGTGENKKKILQHQQFMREVRCFETLVC